MDFLQLMTDLLHFIAGTIDQHYHLFQTEFLSFAGKHDLHFIFNKTDRDFIKDLGTIIYGFFLLLTLIGGIELLKKCFALIKSIMFAIITLITLPFKALGKLGKAFLNLMPKNEQKAS